MTYYDVSCFRHNDKQYPSNVVYRLKFIGNDNGMKINETSEDVELAKNILLENKGNKNVDNALEGYFTRYLILKYESY